MATPVQRRLSPLQVRRFGSGREAPFVVDLTKIQTESYRAFLQDEMPPEKRKNQGLEGVLREIFPIESYDKTLRLEYIRYELGKPRYEPHECRQLRLTYGRPFRVWLRLTKEQPIEEEVYLGDMPIMLGGGEFIINGAERVVVSQLHRSPGIDFVSEMEGVSERKMHSCRIIPERGSWIEINITRKESLAVRIDQSGKFSAITLLRAMSPKYSFERDIIRAFYETSVERIVDGRSVTKIEGKMAVDDVVYPPSSDRSGELIVEAGQRITKNAAEYQGSHTLVEYEPGRSVHASLSAGKGFAPFGTDDPMSRPIFRYPVNHHLAQITPGGMDQPFLAGTIIPGFNGELHFPIAGRGLGKVGCIEPLGTEHDIQAELTSRGYNIIHRIDLIPADKLVDEVILDI